MFLESDVCSWRTLSAIILIVMLMHGKIIWHRFFTALPQPEPKDHIRDFSNDSKYVPKVCITFVVTEPASCPRSVTGLEIVRRD